MSEKITKVITDAQDILARYIVPDSGISDHECINQLLGLLDGSQTREALSAPSATRAPTDSRLIRIRQRIAQWQDEDEAEHCTMLFDVERIAHE